MTERDHGLRTADEMELWGGQSVLEETLLDHGDRDTWDKQALVLSYIRENADKYEACRKAEVLRPMLLEWERHDALGWCEKRKDAEDEAITRLRTVIIQRIHDGTIKSPSAAVLKLLHTLGAPDTYAATGEDKNRYDPWAVMDKYLDKYTEDTAGAYGEDEIDVEAHRRAALILMDREKRETETP